MKSLFQFFLILHIIGGTLGLLSGTINILMKKGNKRHKQNGKLFVYGMLTAGFSSLVLALLHPNIFLFMTGVFTLYMVGTGSRYIRLRLVGINQKPKLLDWSLTISMLFGGIFLISQGIYFLLNSTLFGWVYVTFGLFGFLFVKGDLDNYMGKFRFKNYWLLAHVSRMTGGYIASVTAFLVVNTHHLPVPLPLVFIWLFPSLIIVPFIIIWTKKLAVNV
ncbi:MAG TPA: hypothetical protein DIW47_13455 [Bacteroidetes bacterium]|nr:hypothetical protein [Bacteroidota bacterium]